jgi:copper chaperone
MHTGLQVSGMTCEHCVSAVTQELNALGGVQEVRVDLVAGGASTVTVTSCRSVSARMPSSTSPSRA